MGFTHEECVGRIARLEGYRIQFEAVFGGPPTKDTVARAIATFERTILAGGSPYDYFEAATPFHRLDLEEEDDPDTLRRWAEAIAGELEHPLSDAAYRGRELFFGKASCSACHVGWDLSDELFHNLGIEQEGDSPHPGRMAVTKKLEDKGAFKTPGLHNVAFTAPYMHDGSLATLEEVVEHYDKGGTPNDNLSDKIFPLKLTAQEKADLVTFLREGLSGEVTPVTPPRLP
jgi:cytochrome c peroxidase